MKKYLIGLLFLISCTPSKQTTVVLDGSKSYDVDGKIVSYKWKQITGANSILFYSDSNKALMNTKKIGTYQYELTGIDNDNAIGKDTVKVQVIK